MPFGDIRIGSGDGPIVTEPSDKGDGGYFVEGKPGASHGPFADWEEATQERASPNSEAAGAGSDPWRWL